MDAVRGKEDMSTKSFTMSSADSEEEGGGDQLEL